VLLHKSKLCFTNYNTTITKSFISCTSYFISQTLCYVKRCQTLCQSYFEPTISTIRTYEMHTHTHPSCCVAHSYTQTILSFHIPYALSALTSHSAVPTHCACQPQRTKRLAEQVSYICKKSHLYRTISLDGQRRKLCTLLSPPRTEECHYKGRFSLPYSKNKKGARNIGDNPVSSWFSQHYWPLGSYFGYTRK